MYGRILDGSNKETIDGCRPYNASDNILQLNDYKFLYNVSSWVQISNESNSREKQEHVRHTVSTFACEEMQ